MTIRWCEWVMFLTTILVIPLATCAQEPDPERTGSRINRAIDDFRSGLDLELRGAGKGSVPVDSQKAVQVSHPKQSTHGMVDEAIDKYRGSLGLGLTSEYLNDEAAHPGPGTSDGSEVQTLHALDPDGTPSQAMTMFRPTEGFVPDERAAIGLAKAIWQPIYGAADFQDHQPMQARLVDGVWHVQGTLKQPRIGRRKGGVPYAWIRKLDGKVIGVNHGK